MDGISPIEAFLAGRLPEDEFLKEVDRVIAEGPEADRTILISDWRTKSGRIRSTATKEKLDERLQPIAWLVSDGPKTDDPQATSKPGKSLQPGDVLDNRFVIEGRIGAGGMSTVFKARDLRREEAQDRNPYVAVKTLNIELLQREDALKILQREARKAQSLAHPNIVRVYDFDRDGDTLFITMELLEGVSLEGIIRENGLLGASLATLRPILEQVVSALQFAHSEGIIHSDLKPANILVLSGGRVKVIDFGIARAIPNPDASTKDRTTFDVHALGAMTPAYASPEMIEGQDPDPRDDVFGLSCIVYEFLTGRHPFGRTPASMARAGNFRPQEPVNLSPHQWRALQAGLQLDRSKRLPTPNLLLSGLLAEDPTLFERSRRFAKNGAIPGIIAAGILIGIGVYVARPITEDLSRKQAQQKPVGGEAQQRAADEAAQRQAEQKAADEAAQRQAEQKAADEAAQRQAQQRAADEVAQRQAQQRAADEAAQRQAQRKAADEAAQRQAQRKAADEAAQRQAQQRAADEAAQRQAEQKAADEAAQRQAQQRAADEAAQRQAQQRAADEAAQRQAQQRAADEAAQRQAQQRAADEAAQSSPLVPGNLGPAVETADIAHISEAQRSLAKMGLLTGAIDGKLGARTREAIRAFQLSEHLSDDGQLSETLIAKLREAPPPPELRAQALAALATESARVGKISDAIRLYSASVSLEPANAGVLIALGDLYKTSGRLDATRRYWSQAARLGGDTAAEAKQRLASLPPPSNWRLEVNGDGSCSAIAQSREDGDILRVTHRRNGQNDVAFESEHDLSASSQLGLSTNSAHHSMYVSGRTTAFARDGREALGALLRDQSATVEIRGADERVIKSSFDLSGLRIPDQLFNERCPP
jgi:peptidoglycan hydrolase-like protein with peptidoglycan-binding domain